MGVIGGVLCRSFPAWIACGDKLAMVSSQTCAAAWIVLKSVNSSPCRKFFLTTKK